MTLGFSLHRSVAFTLFMLAAFVLLNDRPANAADPVVSPLTLKTIPTGVYDLDRTVVIPRQRGLLNARNNTQNGVPAPYLGKNNSWPGGFLRGEDRFGTVLRFAPSVRGCLIKTEGYGDGTAGGFWNHNNELGDTTLKSNLCSSASNFTVDGQAEFRPYPHAYFDAHPKPDPHGPDFVPRADGLCAEGAGFSAENLRFFKIPGTALIVRLGRGPQAGAFGVFDGQPTEIRQIVVHEAVNGIQVEAGDTKLSDIYISNVVKDGLIVRGPGTMIEGDHICGADRAAVFSAVATASNCYHEAARIGTHILPGAECTRIDGLNIGPGTCTERGVKIEASGTTIVGLFGMMPAESEKHPDVVGVEIGRGPFNVSVEGSVTIMGDNKSKNSTAKALTLSGHGHKVDLRGGWNVPTKATFVRVAGSATGCKIEIRGHGDGGTALDLSASQLDRVNGLGNEFKVFWAGKAARVIYPGGGTTYNLAPGTQLWIDGVLQSAQAAKTDAK
jgi:hypothetical protein